MHTSNIASAESYAALLEKNGCALVAHDDLSDDWKEILVRRLEMYRSLRDTTIAEFGEARFLEYDKAYAVTLSVASSAISSAECASSLENWHNMP